MARISHGRIILTITIGAAGLTLFGATVYVARLSILSWWTSVPKVGVLALFSGGFLATAIGLWARSWKDEETESGFRILPWWTVILGLFTAAIATWGSISWLTQAAKGDPKLEFDAIKTGLTVGVGVAGLAALLLTVRKQWLSERVHKHQEEVSRRQEHDATERRVTELYTKAADQLGNEKAAVRLAGLYALERLGQSHTEHRQTIVNVICAYLRIPFDGPTLGSNSDSESADDNGGSSDLEQERQVRWAAQDILQRHLFRGGKGDSTPETLWEGMNVDLSSSRLGRGGFDNCTFRSANFSHTNFDNGASFMRARFIEHAIFIGSRFEGAVRFNGATFLGKAYFNRASFRKMALFRSATFGDRVNFSRVQFNSGSSFEGSKFNGVSSFEEARFSGEARFNNAYYARRATFNRANFIERVVFHGVVFSGDRFNSQAAFEGTTFRRSAVFKEVRFRGEVNFDHAKFESRAFFSISTFGSRSNFRNTEFEGNVEFNGAKFEDHASFGGAVFSRRSEFNSVLFGGGVFFRGANFYKDPWFGRSVFRQQVNFCEVELASVARFNKAKFFGDMRFDHMPEQIVLNEARAHKDCSHNFPAGWRLGDESDPEGLNLILRDNKNASAANKCETDGKSDLGDFCL